MADKVKLYNKNDGVTGRTGGPYLDEVQAQEAEIRRAAIEGREPEEAIQPYAGMQLVPASVLLETINVNNTPSEDGKFELAKAIDSTQYGAPVAAEVALDSSDEVNSSSSDSGDSNSGRRRAG